MIWLILCFVFVAGEDSNDAYKDQYCTDPRTMKKHAAYTEWADAYSCTRHRCQPGGRNLAIYTVGCKRVEAPESAIECEEVVEDTNMQFPYCCTRLRCLVVVRGEVWTRVLGQPWETLPAAPWSHMYKMKKPPPGNEFMPKNANEGPVYELSDSDGDKTRDKVLRASKTTDPNCNDAVPRASPPSPDIVIALTTNDEQNDLLKEQGKMEKSDRKHHSKTKSSNQYLDEEAPEPNGDVEDLGGRGPEKIHPTDLVKSWTKDVKSLEQMRGVASKENPPEVSEEARDGRDYYSYSYSTQKPKGQHHRASWTEVPPPQWSEREPSVDQEGRKQQQESTPAEPVKKPIKPEKPGKLKALVDAIGSRMRDIESVVQKMSEKVNDKPEEPEGSIEKGQQENEIHGKYSQERKSKKPSADGEHYKRFSVRNRGSKYLHGAVDGTTEAPIFVEDNANGYFSDASNSVLRRSNPRVEPKADEPAQAPTYMAPVENRRKSHPSPPTTSEEKTIKKHRKHTHKKKKRGGKTHKRHHKDGEKKHKYDNNNRGNSVENNDRIVISLEDSSAGN